jgi:hypothetical protein
VLITFALPIEKAEHVSHFMSNIGHQVGAAFAEIDKRTTQKESPKWDSQDKNWQEQLWTSIFLRTPAVWRKAGSDEQFLDFLRGQPCAFCRNFDYLTGSGEKRCEAAHVRRVANGAGVGIKPEYSAIPLCRDHHRLQHNEGESALGDDDWWSKKRVLYLRTWVWEVIKQDLGVESMKDAQAIDVYKWASDRGVEAFLPVALLP